MHVAGFLVASLTTAVVRRQNCSSCLQDMLLASYNADIDL